MVWFIRSKKMFHLKFYLTSCVRLKQTIADFRNHLEYDHGDCTVRTY